MSAFNTANLGDLVGGWSCITMMLGFTGAAFSYLQLRVDRSAKAPESGAAKVSAIMALVMLLFALFIVIVVLPRSMAYSGPTPFEVRVTWSYDKYLAALIALGFAVVFVFDAFWLKNSPSPRP